MNTRNEIDQFAEYFDSEEQAYERTEDGSGGIRIRFNIGCKLGVITESIFIYEDTLIVLAQCAPRVDEKQRIHAAEYLTRINYELYLGHFQLDLDTGDIMYRISQSLGDDELSKDIIAKIICMPLAMFKKYEDGLNSITSRIATPENTTGGEDRCYCPLRKNCTRQK